MQAQARDGLGGGPGAGVHELQPAPGAGRPEQRRLQFGGERGGRRERGPAHVAHRAPGERRLDGDRCVVRGTACPEQVGDGAVHVRDAQPPSDRDLARREGHPVHAHPCPFPAECEPGVGEVQGVGAARGGERLDPPERGGTAVTDDEPRLEELHGQETYRQVGPASRLAPRPGPQSDPPFAAQPPRERAPRPAGFQRGRGEQHPAPRQRPQLRPRHGMTLPERGISRSRLWITSSWTSFASRPTLDRAPQSARRGSARCGLAPSTSGPCVPSLSRPVSRSRRRALVMVCGPLRGDLPRERFRR